jgi:class 3 adenylate cyclase/tetratricopeptide (TPR) repeat protein
MAVGESAAAFGQLLRDHRRAAGLTQAALATRAGLSERGIQNLERGVRRPYPATLQRLAQALRLDRAQRAALEATLQEPQAPVSIEGYRPRRGVRGQGDRAAGVGVGLGAAGGALPPRGDLGEWKPATVLCARIGNLPLLAARLRPGELRFLVDGVLRLACREVARYGGVVERVDQSGLVALFGVPVAQEDHAARALHAALAMREVLASYRARERRRWGGPLTLSAALDSGPLLVRPAAAGSMLAEEAPAPLVRAARLQRAAPPGAILVGEATWQAGGAAFVGRRSGPLIAASDGTAYQAHELLYAAGPRGPEAPETTPLVGRAGELAQLQAAWEEARQGRGRVVSVVGEAGIGKSRLLREFARALTAAGAAHLAGSCFAYADVIPYLPFQQVLRRRFGAESAPPATGKGRVAQRLATLGLDAALAPFLHALLGYPADDPLLDRLPAHLVRARIVEAARDVLLAEAARQPFALFVEDFHWIDQGSEEIVGALVEALPDAPLLLVLAYRPQHLVPWGAAAPHTTLALDPLPRASAAALARAVLVRPQATRLALPPLAADEAEALARGVARERPLPVAVARQVARRAGGNPLFVEALTQALLAGEISRPARDAAAAGGDALPPTVQDVLLARVDHLAAPLRQTLQAATAIGPTFTYPLLAAVADPALPLEPALLQLEELDLILPTRVAPEREYAFKHVLLQNVVYDALVPEARAAYHERIGGALETLYPDRLEERYELLAYHYGRGANADKAVEYLALANRKVAASNALAEAYGYFREAMARLDTLPDSAPNQYRRLSLLLEQFVVMLLLGKLPEYHAQLRRCEQIAADVAAPAVLGAYYARLAACEWASGALAAGQATARRAAALCEDAGDAEGAGVAYATLGRCELDLGHYEAALAAHERALRAFDERFQLRWYMWTWTAALWAHAYRGRWAEAHAAGAEALRVGEEYDDATTIHAAARDLALVCIFEGDLSRALVYTQRAAETALTPVEQAFVAGVQALVAVHLRQPSAAPPTILVEIAAGLRAGGFVPPAIVAGVHAGEALWLAGDAARARAVLEEYRALAAQSGMRYFEGRAERLLGEIVLAAAAAAPGPHLSAADGPPAPQSRDDLVAAEAYFARATALLEAQGAENELALARAGQGRLLARRGDPAGARAHFEWAETTLRRLGTLGAPDAVARALAALAEPAGTRPG